MAGSLNRVTLIGHLGRDPEVRSTQDGKKIVTLSVATSESWKDRSSGERKEKAEWHRVVIFNEGLAEVAGGFMAKGSRIMVEGQLKTRKWTDNAGVEKYSTEVVLQGFDAKLILLDSPKSDNNRRVSDAKEPSSQNAPMDNGDPYGDEIPF